MAPISAEIDGDPEAFRHSSLRRASTSSHHKCSVLVIGAEERSFWCIIDFISISSLNFCGVLQSLIVGKVTFDVEKVANFADCRYYR